MIILVLDISIPSLYHELLTVLNFELSCITAASEGLVRQTGGLNMTHTLNTRRISPKPETTNAAARREAAPKPVPLQDAHPTLAWIARLLARQATREDYRRLSLGCGTIDMTAIMAATALVIGAVIVLMRHGRWH
jgi:hypothetical protein